MKALLLILAMPLALAACGQGHMKAKPAAPAVTNNSAPIVDITKPKRECADDEDKRFINLGKETPFEKIPAGIYEYRSGEVYAGLADKTEQVTQALAVDAPDKDKADSFSSDASLECTSSVAGKEPSAKPLTQDVSARFWFRIKIDEKYNVTVGGSRTVQLSVNKVDAGAPFKVKSDYIEIAKSGFEINKAGVLENIENNDVGPFASAKVYMQPDDSLVILKTVSKLEDGKSVVTQVMSRYVRVDGQDVKASAALVPPPQPKKPDTRTYTNADLGK